MRKRIRTALATLLVSASTPAFAFYQDMRCERNTATGQMELESQTSYVAKQWDTYRIVAEKDILLPTEPWAVPGRPGWVFGMCLVEGHWSRVPDDAPIRFPRQ